MPRPAEGAGVLRIGGDLPVHRLGFGAMRLTGSGIWGPPEDRDGSIQVLKELRALGVNFVDTADSYGPFVSEDLIREALHPYPPELVIATKAGYDRPGPGKWVPNGNPEHLRRSCEGSLERLKVERIDLFQLHRVDPKVPLEDQLGVLADLQREGRIRHIGLSEVSRDQVAAAQEHIRIASVQNHYNLFHRRWEDVLDHCEVQGIAFIPWAPLSRGPLAERVVFPEDLMAQLGASPAQVALAWLLHRSPVMLPIPGTSKLEHLKENTAAAMLDLDQADLDAIERAAGRAFAAPGPGPAGGALRKIGRAVRSLLPGSPGKP